MFPSNLQSKLSAQNSIVTFVFVFKYRGYEDEKQIEMKVTSERLFVTLLFSIAIVIVSFY